MIAIARDLAAAHPESKLPCPTCAVSVKAANLDGHLAKVHPGATDALRPWRGKDYRIVVTALLAIPPALAIVGAIIAATPISAGDRTGTFLLAGTGALFLTIALVGLTGIVRGSITLAGDAIRLRHSLLGRRTVRLPCAVEVGGLWGSRIDSVTPAADYNQPTTPRKLGNYLRLSGEGKSITIACRHSTLVREHWTGWTQGPRRRYCDLVIDREALVALEYELAKRGVLALRR